MSNENTKATSGGKSRSLLGILLVLITIAACGFAGYMFWEMKMAKPATEKVAEEKAAAPVNIEPLYQSMSTFTVSLKPTEKESDRVLFLGLSVRVADKESLLMLEKFLPEYRSRLFMLLTQQTYEALSTDEGKRQLINNIKNELNQPLEQNQKISSTDILINEFILR